MTLKSKIIMGGILSASLGLTFLPSCSQYSESEQRGGTMVGPLYDEHTGTTVPMPSGERPSDKRRQFNKEYDIGGGGGEGDGGGGGGGGGGGD